MTATALLDEDAPSDSYSNSAFIKYDRLGNTVSFSSVDRETLDSLTTFYASWQQRQEPVKVTPEYDPTAYSADSQIDVIYKVHNPNGNLTDMFLDIIFNPEFIYVTGSLQILPVNQTSVKPVLLTQESDDPSTLSIAGSSDAENGFTLPAGETIFKFKLQAPKLADIQPELDDNNQPTGKNMPLNVIYNFSSTMSDPCAAMAIMGLEGDRAIPYLQGKTHIISNRNVTIKVVQ